MVRRALIQVFANGKYALLAGVSACAVFVLATWLPNLGLVWQIATSPSISISDKGTILVALVGSIGTNFTVFSALIAIAIAVLFGANLAMTVYLLRERRRLMRDSFRAGGATSLGGLASGFVGIGCAACGTVALTPALAFIGAGSFVAMLPFGGEEFSLLGIGLLGLSFLLTARRIAEPVVCGVENPRAEASETRGLVSRAR